MITKEKVNITNSGFYKKLESMVDNQEAFNTYDKYYKWLKQQEFDSTNDDSTLDEIKINILNLIYSSIQFFNRRNIKAKDFSKEWNKGLVAKVGNYGEEYQERNKNNTLGEQSFKIKEHFVYEDLWNSNDLATASYCWQMLQRSVSYELIPELINSFKQSNSPTPIEHNDKKVLARPKIGGGTINDEGIKYWHTGANELMTYDECTEKGLGHHLLMYPTGHPNQGLYVGFNESDPSKIEKVKRADAEWVEQVMVVPE